jgi:predicted RNA binding protein YcfA (HicA-like mRNA interferase family)
VYIGTNIIPEIGGLDFRWAHPQARLDARTGKSKMPPKVRELIADLERAGFTDRGGKGSHRNFAHPNVSKPVTISGNPGDDAKHYQVRAIRRAIDESQR